VILDVAGSNPVTYPIFQNDPSIRFSLQRSKGTLMKRKDELRDIYQRNSHDLESDFTPQVKVDVATEQKQDIQRMRLLSLFLGGLMIIVIVGVIAVVIKDFLSEQEASTVVPSKEITFIPRHTLPSEATWVVNYQKVADKLDLNDDLAEKPLSAQWVTKAAYHIIMGQQALTLNELDSALEHLLKVVAIYPEIEGVHRSLGSIYIQRDDFLNAAASFEKALQEEELFDVLNNLGAAYIGTEEYDKAKTPLLRALELQKESPQCHKNLAVLYRKMDQEESAMFHFEKYIDLKPGDLGTLQTYALYLTELERWKEAAEFLTTLTQEVPDVAPLYILLAQIQSKNGEQEKALDALQKAIQLVDPDLALTWMSREEFNDVRRASWFKELVEELETASASPNGAP
jgi:tetratricopeptide (TPR) repeat protein